MSCDNRYQAAAQAEGIPSDDWPPPAQQHLEEAADKHEKDVHRAFHRIIEAVAALHSFNNRPTSELKERYGVNIMTTCEALIQDVHQARASFAKYRETWEEATTLAGQPAQWPPKYVGPTRPCRAQSHVNRGGRSCHSGVPCLLAL
jgi:hypothetical protein